MITKNILLFIKISTEEILNIICTFFHYTIFILIGVAFTTLVERK